jgi:integrase
MARALHKLTDRFCRTAPVGRHSDGGGLYLIVSGPSARSWLFRWKVGGKRKELGLGSFRDVPLSLARDLAAQARTDRARGDDPRQQRTARKAGAITFGEAADRLVGDLETGWRNAKHRAQWRATLETLAAPLRPTPVNRITTEDVRDVLAPIWLAKPETAARLRGRIEKVLDWARVRKFRTGDNPARLRGNLEHLLPKQPSRAKRVRHYPALPYADLPALMAELRSVDTIAARALQFAILTAARSGEVLGAKWGEVDFDAEVWAVPRERTKAERPHRVPLPPAALALLRPLAETAFSPFVFPGLKRDQPMSHSALADTLRRLSRRGITAHGFRATFRQWCAEQTNFAACGRRSCFGARQSRQG